MTDRPNLVQGRPTQAEATFLLAADKVVTANLTWEPNGRRYTLEARVLVRSTGQLLRLAANIGERNHSFCLMANNYPLHRLDTKRRHKNPDSQVIRQPHKHRYDEVRNGEWAYVPTDIQFGDINREFMDFLKECKIEHTGSYQALQP